MIAMVLPAITAALGLTPSVTLVLNPPVASSYNYSYASNATWKSGKKVLKATVTMDVNVRVQRVDQRGIATQAQVSNLKMADSGKSDLSKLIQSIERQRTPILLTPQNDTISVNGSTTGQGDRLTGMNMHVASLVTFPSVPVNIGATWTKKYDFARLASPPEYQGGDLTVTMKLERLMSIRGKKAAEVSFISRGYQRPTSGTITTTLKSQGLATIDLATGMIISIKNHAQNTINSSPPRIDDMTLTISQK